MNNLAAQEERSNITFTYFSSLDSQENTLAFSSGSLSVLRRLLSLSSWISTFCPHSNQPFFSNLSFFVLPDRLNHKHWNHANAKAMESFSANDSNAEIQQKPSQPTLRRHRPRRCSEGPDQALAPSCVEQTPRRAARRGVRTVGRRYGPGIRRAMIPNLFVKGRLSAMGRWPFDWVTNRKPNRRSSGGIDESWTISLQTSIYPPINGV